MPNLTVRADEALLSALDSEADARDISRAEYVRRLLSNRHATDERIESLESELTECRTELERTQRAHRQLLDQREEHSSLVAAVERERSLEERWRRASWLTRRKWQLFGMNDE